MDASADNRESLLTITASQNGEPVVIKARGFESLADVEEVLAQIVLTGALTNGQATIQRETEAAPSSRAEQ
tara:strand:- start:24 stop:236 length:213 start_codon:yes stop_codon:yes gene_type:complete